MMRTVNTVGLGLASERQSVPTSIQGSENIRPGNIAPQTTGVTGLKYTTPEPEKIIVEHRTKDAFGLPIVKKYLRGQLLGKGGFAKCYQFTDMESGQIWAGKVVAKSSLTKARHKAKLQTEIKIHKALAHQCIVKIEEVFEDKENVYLIMELCENQTLLELVKRKKRLSEPETRHFLTQLLHACKYMHGVRVIHRDLKLGNLFLSSKCTMKVGDFGLASKLAYDGERKRTLCGTPNYIAPEVLDGKNGHSYEVDVWSIGVILYTLLVGKPPFETSDVKSTYKRIKALAYSFPERTPVSESAKNLVRCILRSEPEKRPTLDDIINHEFCRDEIYAPLSDPTARLPLRTLTIDNGDAKDTRSTSRPDMPRATTSSTYRLTSTATSSALESKPYESKPYDKPYESKPYDKPYESKPYESKPYESKPYESKPYESKPYESKPFESKPYVMGYSNKYTSSTTTATTSTAPRHDERLHVGTGLTSDYRSTTVSRPSENPMGAADRILSELDRYRTAHRPPVASSSDALRSDNQRTADMLSRPSTAEPSSGTTTGPVGPLFQGIGTDMHAAPTTTTTATTNPTTDYAQRDTERDRLYSAGGLLDRLGNNEAWKEDPNCKDSAGVTAPEPAKEGEDEDRGTLHCMHLNLQKSFAAAEAAPVVPTVVPDDVGDNDLPMPSVWVSQWVDYSKKYGLGYKLSDGTSGVFFNDATKMLLDPEACSLEYIERVRGEAGVKQDIRKKHVFATYPTELKKKVTLLQHFKNYLEENQSKANSGAPPTGPSGARTNGDEGVYVRKWMRTRHSIIFRMSNNNFQVNFFDGTEVFLWSDSRWVTYRNKAKVRKTYELGTVLQYPELAKRIKYVKDILSQLIGRA